MSKKEKDIDEEIKKLARKTIIDIQKAEYSFDKQIKKLDKEIDDVVRNQINDFDNLKQFTSDYLSIDYSSSTINQYREKLKRI